MEALVQEGCAYLLKGIDHLTEDKISRNRTRLTQCDVLKVTDKSIKITYTEYGEFYTEWYEIEDFNKIFTVIEQL